MATQLNTIIGEIAARIAGLNDGEDPPTATFARVYTGLYDPLTIVEVPAVILWPDQMTLGGGSDGKMLRTVPVQCMIVAPISSDGHATRLLDLHAAVAGILEPAFSPVLSHSAGVAAPNEWDYDGSIDEQEGQRVWATGSFTIRWQTAKGVI